MTHGILKEDNKRYGNSYIFIEELLLSGGIFLILSTIFNDLEFLSKILVTAYLLITAPAAVTKLVINTAIGTSGDRYLGSREDLGSSEARVLGSRSRAPR
jgi:hypothetical protein